MSFVWSFEPEEPTIKSVREEYVPRKEKPKLGSWVAPEHARSASGMIRDYPRDEKGQKIEGTERELKIDKRPTIMVPPRRTKIGLR